MLRDTAPEGGKYKWAVSTMTPNCWNRRRIISNEIYNPGKTHSTDVDLVVGGNELMEAAFHSRHTCIVLRLYHDILRSSRERCTSIMRRPSRVRFSTLNSSGFPEGICTAMRPAYLSAYTQRSSGELCVSRSLTWGAPRIPRGFWMPFSLTFSDHLVCCCVFSST